MFPFPKVKYVTFLLWTPKPWKMKLSILKHMGEITPQYWGCGFPGLVQLSHWSCLASHVTPRRWQNVAPRWLASTRPCLRAVCWLQSDQTWFSKVGGHVFFTHHPKKVTKTQNCQVGLAYSFYFFFYFHLYFLGEDYVWDPFWLIYLSPTKGPMGLGRRSAHRPWYPAFFFGQIQMEPIGALAASVSPSWRVECHCRLRVLNFHCLQSWWWINNKLGVGFRCEFYFCPYPWEDDPIWLCFFWEGWYHELEKKTIPKNPDPTRRIDGRFIPGPWFREIPKS